MTLTPAAKTLMGPMSVLAAVDTKEMDALAWVSMKDAVIKIGIKKDLRITRKGCLFISTQNTATLNQTSSP